MIGEETFHKKMNLNHMNSHIDIFVCPTCQDKLKITMDNIECLNCYRSYKVENDIPILFADNNWQDEKKDVTKKIKSFYEKTPFPNYEGLESVTELIQKAEKGIFARLLQEQIPFSVKILEVGCGTGQLSNFLGIYSRHVFGVDISMNSLKLANNFRARNGLKNVSFYQMNLFKPVFKEESFDLVICNGVLHHTSDPFLGFKSIANLVKKDGYIMVGLYNKYGRIITDIRRFIFNIFNNYFKFLDPRLREKGIGEMRKNTWFMDQYKNPHESKHTIKEILEWFDKNEFEFVNSLPKPKFFLKITEKEKLFKINSRGNFLDRFLTQFKMIFSKNNEGGFFIMIAKKR